VVLLLALYLGRPRDRAPTATLVLLGVGLVLLVLLLGWQVRSVVRSPYPVLRAVEAFVTATVLFVILFAGGYTALSEATPGSFTEPSSWRPCAGRRPAPTARPGPRKGGETTPRTPLRPLRRAGRSRRPDRRLRTPGPGAPRPRSSPPGCRPSGSARGRAP
jgi:hypothetical protein